ncbi:MAG TPA: fatty acyl-AMP ligase [Vicinamibacterales bacterium]|jgi:fatty-acyl-CoA synthase|nr:fatty acyl-AMP ligase [Vicinamibacterales bacterium]
MARCRTLVDALDEAARSAEGYTFISEGVETRRSYAEIRRASERVARGLLAAGLKPGDLVALVIADAEAFLTALFGAAQAGIVPATMAPPTTTGGLSQYFELTMRTVRAARARAVITSRGLLAGFDAMRARCTELALVVTPDDLARAERESPEAREPIAPARGADDIALVQFTSGSTSSPKGVALSHRNLCANIDAINGPAGLGTSPDDSAVSWLPLYHDMGLVGMALGPLYSSRPALFLEPQAFIKRPVDWLKAISRHRATVSFAPTFAYQLVLRRVSEQDLIGLDLSCWRVAGCGAEPVHAPTLHAFADRLAGVGFRPTSFLPCYGLAEHVLAATLPPRDRPLRTDASSVVSCGRPLPGHRLKVVKPDGTNARDGEPGEIVLSGPSVMQGYLRDEATGAAVRAGWLHTGDLGYLYDGELFVCGRAKDTIIINGRKYFPQDLEWAIENLDGVRRGRVVAFGIVEHGANDRVVVAVEAGQRPGRERLVEDIRRRIADQFGLYVDDVVCVAAGTISRTTSGKIRRAAVKAHYEEGTLVNSGGGF